MAENEPFYTEFNSAFWLTISASVFAFLGMALRACLKSRCRTIACCSQQGLVACEREPVADEFTNLGEVKVERPSEDSQKPTAGMARNDTISDLQEGTRV